MGQMEPELDMTDEVEGTDSIVEDGDDVERAVNGVQDDMEEVDDDSA